MHIHSIRHTISVLLMTSILSSSLSPAFAGRSEDEAAERAFTQAHPWYGNLVEAAKEMGFGPFSWWRLKQSFSNAPNPPESPPPLIPAKGMEFAAERYLSSDTTEDQLKKAHEWLNQGVEAKVPMGNAGNALLRGANTPEIKLSRLNFLFGLKLSQDDKTQIVPGLLEWTNTSSFCLTLLNFMAAFELPPEAKKLVSEKYGQIFSNTYYFDRERESEGEMFKLLDALYRFDPDATIEKTGELLDSRTSHDRLGERELQLLIRLKGWDARVFETIASQLLDTKALQLTELLNQNPKLADLMEGSCLSADRLLDLGCSFQHPQSVEIFKSFLGATFLGADKTVIEKHKTKIATHLGTYLAHQRESGVYDVLNLLRQEIESLVEAAIRALTTYYASACVTPAGLYAFDSFIGKVSTLQATTFETVHGDLFQAFNRASFHQGVQLLWLNQIKSKREEHLGEQILSYFGVSKYEDLNPIPDADAKDTLSLSLYDALTSPSQNMKKRARDFIVDAESTGLLKNIHPAVVTLGPLASLSDPDVTVPEKLKAFKALFDAGKFNEETLNSLKDSPHVVPLVKDVMESSLKAVDQKRPSVERCAATNHLYSLKEGNEEIQIPGTITRDLKELYRNMRWMNPKPTAYLVVPDSGFGNYHLNPNGSVLYAFGASPRYFTTGEGSLYNQVFAFDTDHGRPLWVGKLDIFLGKEDYSSPELHKRKRHRYLCEVGPTVCAVAGNRASFIQKDTGAIFTAIDLVKEDTPFSLKPWGEDKFVLTSGEDDNGFPRERVVSVFSSQGTKVGDYPLETHNNHPLSLQDQEGPWVSQYSYTTGALHIRDLNAFESAPQAIQVFGADVDPKGFDRHDVKSAIRGNHLLFMRVPQEEVYELVCFDLARRQEVWSSKLPEAVNSLFFSSQGTYIFAKSRSAILVYATAKTSSSDDDDIPPQVVQGFSRSPAKDPTSFLELDDFMPLSTDENILYAIVDGTGEVNELNIKTGNKRFLYEAKHGRANRLFGFNAKGTTLIYSFSF